MKDRLKALRKDLGLTQQEFAEKIGVKRNTVATYEIGRNEPIDSVINLICDRCHVNEQWLRTGEGGMYVDKKEDDEIKSRVDSLRADEDLKRRLISSILRLDNEKLEDYLNWIKVTFDLVERKPFDGEMSIDEKVDAYRAELEAEEAARISGASPTGSESIENTKSG